MTGLEAAASVGQVVAKRAGREWLAARAAATDRDKDLTELIRVSFPDRFARRRLERQLADIADSVEKRLGPLIEQEYGGLADNDRAAALAEVESALEQADLSDETLFAIDADPVKLARRLRALVPAPQTQLGEASARLYDVALDECCDCLVRVVLGLAEFTPRALAETLSRLSDLGDQVATALDRIPARSLDAPSGSQDDAEFERRYREHISRTLDEIELFGLRVEHYRPRATLSVAYISLTVTAEDPRREDHAPLKTAGHRRDPAPSTMRAEAMLARSPRTLLRGQAGSGKSTLLGWVAVTAARGAFTGELTDWNGRVPFLIRLRSLAERDLPGPDEFVTGPLSALAPSRWVHRILDAGRGVLLVDGVDEVPHGQRENVRQWLRTLLDVYPKLRTVVTSRPAAADTRWLSAEGFLPVMLEPMMPDALHELIRQWHVAVRQAGSLPCEPEELPAYEGTLLARLESGPHLRALATTPLLAAMLCALNLDRVMHLPRDRMGLYRAVLDMLLERRDIERGIRSHPGIELELEQKERLLQELAWRLTVLGRSEMSKITALRRIEARSQAMPRVTASAEEILDYLLQRSGVIREPVPDRIDFVHRTVQEYLAARQAADDADVETLVKKAHLDQWRETVVMAAGHTNAPLRHQLLSDLLDRADARSRHAHRLRMLVAACLETIPDVPSNLRARVDRCVSTLIPPRNVAQARRLAAAGEEVLERLPESLEELSEARAVATVRTAWLVNGESAMGVLARYAADPRWKVQSELIDAWNYFEPHAYAERVLRDAPLDDGWLTVGNPTLLPALRSLRSLRRLIVNLPRGTGLECLTGVPALAHLNADRVRPDALHLLAGHSSLESLQLTVDGVIEDVAPLLALPSLESLDVTTSGFSGGLAFVAALPALRELRLAGLRDIRDFAPIGAQRTLERLDLDGCPSLSDLEVLRPLGKLWSLDLASASLGEGGCAQIADVFPRLRHLYLPGNEWVDQLDALANLPLELVQLKGCFQLTDIGPLARLRDLEYLDLNGVPFTDLEPLAELQQLGSLFIGGCGRDVSLTPLSGLQALRSLSLLDADDGVDLGPLAGLRDLNIRLYEGQTVLGTERLHGSTKIHWVPRSRT
jgi:Leucine-rich repeat (LRR) protein